MALLRELRRAGRVVIEPVGLFSSTSRERDQERARPTTATSKSAVRRAMRLSFGEASRGRCNKTVPTTMHQGRD